MVESGFGMRTALHAAGAGTPNWPTGEALTKLIDSVGSRLQIERVETEFTAGVA